MVNNTNINGPGIVTYEQLITGPMLDLVKGWESVSFEYVRTHDLEMLGIFSFIYQFLHIR